MTPVVSIIMGSTSDLPVMEKAAKFLDEMEIPFEMHALSAHRTPEEVENSPREPRKEVSVSSSQQPVWRLICVVSSLP